MGQLTAEMGLALVAGTLFGLLRTSDGLVSGKIRVLGRDALELNDSLAWQLPAMIRCRSSGQQYSLH